MGGLIVDVLTGLISHHSVVARHPFSTATYPLRLRRSAAETTSFIS